MSVSLLMNRLLSRSLRTCESFSKRFYAEKTKKGILSEIDAEETPVYEVELKFAQEEIDKMRLKSRLEPKDRNIMQGRKPYDESFDPFHDSVWYRKRMMGRYGMEAAGFSPAIAWPTEAEIQDQVAWEKVRSRVPIQWMWRKFGLRKRKEAELIAKLEKKADKAVRNFDKWRAELQARIDEKEAKILAAKQKREKVLEEVRERFAYLAKKEADASGQNVAEQTNGLKDQTTDPNHPSNKSPDGIESPSSTNADPKKNDKKTE
ncbi:hypothetical protein QAD02_012303 [Eretmocerus hayati]|uniref:Uncharacterized protein n=1 Tax=Eretmocerus hayati TaxID=131215 RepID=A0ACC2P0D0_9HYME|nr:hypothetical protein QAD02_012303 [Eretmocerus hayati]